MALALASAPGCSSRVEGKGQGGRPPALVYQQGGLPGVTHSAHPDAPPAADGPGGASAPATPPLTCAQQALEAESAQALERWLKVPGGARQEPLPADRAEHVNPVGTTRFLLALPIRHPDARKGARSMRATGAVRIRYSPDHDAEEVGLLQRGQRIPVTGFAGRQGCRAGWMALGPHAFVCASRLKPDARPPAITQLPKVPAGRITPGVYGYIRPGGAPAYATRDDAAKKVMTRRLPGGFFIRFGRFVRIKDRNYWKTTKGLYVPIDRIARHVPSRYHGFRLGDGEATAAGTRGLAPKGPKVGKKAKPWAALSKAHARRPGGGQTLRLPLAIVRYEGAGKRGIPVYHTPGKSRSVGRLHRYTAVNVLGTVVRPSRRSRRTRYLRIGPCQWIEARAARVAHQEPPPPGVTAGERWIDVDLKRQVLVAYEGREPVYATLISTGKKQHETRHGLFRIYWKVSEVDMANESGANEEYLAEAVPWSMFFWKGQALHGAYWHDDFGRVKSHGCVNLSPVDARFLFEWATPTLPAGWRHSWHGDRFPGTLVRVRRRRGERPRFLGLARKLAPKEAVIARDEAYQRRIQQETLEMLGGGKSDDDDDDDADENGGSGASGAGESKAPGKTSASKSASAPRASAGRATPKGANATDDDGPRAAPRPRARKAAARRPARPAARRAPRRRAPRRGGLRPSLRPIDAPPPPPRGRR